MNKINLINALHDKVCDYEVDGEICYYVYVPLDEEVRGVLNLLELSDQWIELNKSYSGCDDLIEIIDLAQVGFDICGAKWWDSEIGFCIGNPEH